MIGTADAENPEVVFNKPREGIGKTLAGYKSGGSPAGAAECWE